MYDFFPGRGARPYLSVFLAFGVILLAGLTQQPARSVAEEPGDNATGPLFDGLHYWFYDDQPGGQTLTIHHSSSRTAVAGYDLSGCLFCDAEEDNCPMDGIFPVLTMEPEPRAAVGVVCHVGAHSQRFMLLSPADDINVPTLSETGAYSVVVMVGPEGVVAETDTRTGEKERFAWPRPAAADAIESEGFPAVEIAPPRPLDVEGEDAALAAFEARLRKIVRARDVEGITALLSDDVMSSYGVDDGVAEFRSYWRLDDSPARSGLWDLLTRLLNQGPVLSDYRQDKLAIYPYFFAEWPLEPEAWDFEFVPDEAVVLRAGPSEAAPRLALLGGEAVRRVEWRPVEGWQFVETSSGQFGYLPADKLFAVLDYRLILTRMAEGWRITHLLAGD